MNLLISSHSTFDEFTKCQAEAYATYIPEEHYATRYHHHDVDAAADNIYVFGTLTASGSYSTGGDTLDFTTVASQIAASQPPLQVWVGGSTGDAYSWIKAARSTTKK